MPSWIEMGEEVKEKFKKCGQEVKIYTLAKIVKPEAVEIGEFFAFQVKSHNFSELFTQKDILESLQRVDGATGHHLVQLSQYCICLLAIQSLALGQRPKKLSTAV